MVTGSSEAYTPKKLHYISFLIPPNALELQAIKCYSERKM